MHIERILWVGLFALLGCGEGPRDEELMGPASSGADSTGAPSMETTDSGPMVKLDVGSGGGSGNLDLNCDAIDFLFVIDNSSSMEREQQRLVEAVPGFTESILTSFPTISDVRVGVLDTDSYPGLGSTNPLEGCPDDGSVDCASCDYTLGAMLTKPDSAIDPASSCNFSTGMAYMDARADSFADEFACVANVGVDGNQIEQQAGAMVSALSPAQLQGGCNDGFIRDNALLIVLLITDEEDDHSEMPAPQGGSLGEPLDWRDAVIEAKNGLAQNVVALGLVGGEPLFNDCDSLGLEGNGAEASPRLVQFLQSFDVNFVGSVCQNEYGAFFDDALTQVAQGCAQFVPG